MTDYLTTKELAALLRIKQRKVYALAASGQVPCSRAMGKLLFPRNAIEAWIARNGTGLEARMGRVGPTATGAVLPDVILGSHDPLLDWALRESQCGLASYFDSSGDGIERFLQLGGIATGLHLYDPASAQWNTPLVRGRCAGLAVVLIEWAKRRRGLIVAPRLQKRIGTLSDLAGHRVVPRQAGAGAQALFCHLAERSGLRDDAFELTRPVRSETDAALAVLEGKADAAFGLAALAAQYRLAFVPLIEERFDLLVDRSAWFNPPMQALLRFCRSAPFKARAAELQGYDVADFGTVHFNAPRGV